MATAEQRKQYNRAYYLRGGKANVTAHRAANRATLRAAIKESKDVPCTDCGELHPPYVMDFDHLDPTTKVMSVADMVTRNVSLVTLMAEIAKCEVVCANCHRIRTHDMDL